MRLTTLALLPLLASLAACGSPPPPARPASLPEPAPAAPEPPMAAKPSAVPSASPSASAAAPLGPEDKYAKVVIKVTKVAGSVYVLEGAGGNIGVSVGDDGIVLVDDQFAPLAQKIKDALKGITDRPIRVVLNTHWHGDHTGGNAAFGAMAPIIAHENVRKRLVSGGPAREVGGKTLDPVPPAPNEALPIITFRDEVAIHLNGEEIRAVHLASGHTDGDIAVFFAKSNVVHMGDDFFANGFPFVDLQSGGSVKGMAAALDKVVAELPADVKVIPGHGAVSGLEDVKKFSAALKDCIKLVEAEVKKKKTLAQIQEAKVLAKYDDMGKAYIKPDVFIETIYKELTKQQNVFVPH
jgi:glyoxylase-like metal-dependent hydrolase (beta-lactamase superfamily II)